MRAKAMKIMSQEFKQTSTAHDLWKEMQILAKRRDRKLEAKIDEILRERVGPVKSVSERIQEKVHRNMHSLRVPGPIRVAERLVELAIFVKPPLNIPEDAVMPTSTESSASDDTDS